MAIAASLAANGVLLGLLAWTTPGLRLPTPAETLGLTVELVRLPPPGARSAPSPAVAPRPAATAPTPASTRTARRSPAPPPPTPLPAPAPPARPAPAAPAERPAPAPGPPAPAPRPGPAAGQAAAPASEAAGDVRGAVRAAIGCAHEDYLKLTPAERAACDRKMAEAKPKGAYIDPIPPLKRGAFDRQALHDERCRRYATPVQKPGPARGIDARPVFDSAPSAAEASGPPPPGPWTFC